MTSMEKYFLSLSLSVSRTNIALHVMQRQCSSMLGMSNLGGKLLPLVLTLDFWLLFLFLALSSPLQHGPALTAATKPPQSKPLSQEDRGVSRGQLPAATVTTTTGAHKMT